MHRVTVLPGGVNDFCVNALTKWFGILGKTLTYTKSYKQQLLTKWLQDGLDHSGVVTCVNVLVGLALPQGLRIVTVTSVDAFLMLNISERAKSWRNHHDIIVVIVADQLFSLSQ